MTNRTAYRIAVITAGMFMALLLPNSAHGGKFCKWTDENGVVHYAENCPEETTSELVSTEDERSESQIRAAQEHTDSLLKAIARPDPRGKSNRKYHSLGLEELGPLPPSEKSAYLETTGSGLTVSSKTLTGKLTLFLRGRSSLPDKAWVEAAFPDPVNIENFDLVGKQIMPGQKIILESPSSDKFKCWNYEVLVNVFSDRSKEELIDQYLQVIQSRTNFALVETSHDLLAGSMGGLCSSNDPVDFGRMSAEELELLCQKEREKRLAPERERLVEICVENKGKSREHCERYYADHGDAVRINPAQVRPALYMNLPECIAARKAREEER